MTAYTQCTMLVAVHCTSEQCAWTFSELNNNNNYYAVFFFFLAFFKCDPFTQLFDDGMGFK